MQPHKKSVPRSQSSDEDHPGPAAQASPNLNLRDQLDEHDYEQFLKFFRPKTEAERNMDFSQRSSSPSPRRATRRHQPKSLQMTATNHKIAIELTPEEQDLDLALIYSQLPSKGSAFQTDAAGAANVAAASTGSTQAAIDSSVDEVRPVVQPKKEFSRNQAPRRGRRGRRAARKTQTPKK